MANNLPNQRTPQKIVTITQDGVTLSPNSTSIIKSDGVVLKTPTKIAMIPVSKSSQVQNTIAMPLKQPIAISPSKIIVKPQQGVQQVIKPISASNIQPGSKVQYVRLVSSANGNKSELVRVASSTAGDSKLVQSTLGRPVSAASVGRPASAASAGQQQPGASQRLILPAGAQQTITISSTQSLEQLKAQLPPGTTIITSAPTPGQTQGQVVALLPGSRMSMTQTVRQIQQTPTQPVISAQSTQPTLNTQLASADPMLSQTVSKKLSPTAQASTADSQPNRQRKPCNCTKSQCLKLYCDCFANGEFCSNCNCQSCSNNLDHEEERQRAIKQCLDRNPLAFHPKIGKGNSSEVRRHQKGCNCKRSGCLKNYCECYEAKIPCGSMCKCVGCKNFEESPERRTLMHLADAAEVRTMQQNAAKNKLSSQFKDLRKGNPSGDQVSQEFLKSDVIAAIVDCMLAQCHEAEVAKCKDSTSEKLVFEEFGRCLSQVITASNKSKLT